MTGHGVGQAPFAGGLVEVELRAVNHRSFEARARFPAELLEHAGHVEDLVRRALYRGRVEILCRVDFGDAGGATLDVARARAAFEELTALRDALAPREPIPLALLSAVPGLFVPRTLDVRAARAALAVATERACEAVAEMRAREGAHLIADIESRLDHVASSAAAIETRVPEFVAHVRSRLTARVQQVLGEGVPVDASRLEHEIALFADRSDVTEECTRLASHVEQARDTLRASADGGLGRRLDFLLQEMQRETNTIGQKCGDMEVAGAVVEMKLEIERMREQAQNLL